MLKLQVQIALFGLMIVSIMHCDFVPALDTVVTTTDLFGEVGSVQWCNNCNYLAAGAYDFNNQVGEIAVYKFDQATETLSFINSPTSFGFSGSPAISLCPTCSYLAAGGIDINHNGIIQVYSFNSGSGITPVTHTTFGTGGASVYSIDWCPSCSVFAAGGVDYMGGEIQIYSFSGTDLFTIVGPQSPGSAPISSLKWCGNCNYLAAVDYNAKLYVYTFDGHDLTLSTSISLLTTQTYNSVDVCDDCSYIVAGGQDINGHAVFDIYRFDPRSTESLTTVTSRVISSDSSYVDSVKWCQGCDNLAVGGEDDNTGLGILQLYHFDSQSKILSQPLTATTLNYFANSVNWCGNNCCYLAVGGTQKPDPAFHNICSDDIECCFDSHLIVFILLGMIVQITFSRHILMIAAQHGFSILPTTSAFLHIGSHDIECCFDSHLNRIYATWYDSSHNFQSAYLDDSGTTWILNTAPTTSAFCISGAMISSVALIAI